ncbi:MAG TPA: branched-chain amino acid transaminase [Terriglobales bacterium]|nr:branched-chain amino acid transaminase [Terriglobales bacterium]
MPATSKYIWMSGKLVRYEDATVHFMTPALHYGIGVFEGIRCYSTASGPAIFRLQDHMRRLLDSARVLGFRDLPFTFEQLCEAAREVVAANGFHECYIRPLIYLAEGGWNLTLDTGVPHAAIAVWKWETYFGEEALERGVRANVSSFTRHHSNVMMTKAKISGNYANSVLARTESLRLGFEEAIMLDPQGYVAECTGENIFLVRRGALHTPHAAAILEGITRDSLIVLARALGLRIVEEPVSRDQLYIADEVFVCGTAAEVIALREIDGRTIGSGKAGPVTRVLQREYADAIHGRHSLSKLWLDPVPVDRSHAREAPLFNRPAGENRPELQADGD